MILKILTARINGIFGTNGMERMVQRDLHVKSSLLLSHQVMFHLLLLLERNGYLGILLMTDGSGDGDTDGDGSELKIISMLTMMILILMNLPDLMDLLGLMDLMVMVRDLTDLLDQLMTIQKANM